MSQISFLERLRERLREWILRTREHEGGESMEDAVRNVLSDVTVVVLVVVVIALIIILSVRFL